MEDKPKLRLIRGGGDVAPDGQHANPHNVFLGKSIEDHPARFFRYKDASNFHDLTKPVVEDLKDTVTGKKKPSPKLIEALEEMVHSEDPDNTYLEPVDQLLFPHTEDGRPKLKVIKGGKDG